MEMYLWKIAKTSVVEKDLLNPLSLSRPLVFF